MWSASGYVWKSDDVQLEVVQQEPALCLMTVEALLSPLVKCSSRSCTWLNIAMSSVLTLTRGFGQYILSCFISLGSCVNCCRTFISHGFKDKISLLTLLYPDLRFSSLKSSLVSFLDLPFLFVFLGIFFKDFFFSFSQQATFTHVLFPIPPLLNYIFF